MVVTDVMECLVLLEPLARMTEMGREGDPGPVGSAGPHGPAGLVNKGLVYTDWGRTTCPPPLKLNWFTREEQLGVIMYVRQC